MRVRGGQKLDHVRKKDGFVYDFDRGNNTEIAPTNRYRLV